MNMFDKMKDLNKMRSMLNEMDRKLKERVIETEWEGVVVRVNAKSDVLGLSIPPDLLQKDQTKIEKTILAAIQFALKKAHEAMAEEGKKMTGGMNIPGLM